MMHQHHELETEGGQSSTFCIFPFFQCSSRFPSFPRWLRCHDGKLSPGPPGRPWKPKKKRVEPASAVVGIPLRRSDVRRLQRRLERHRSCNAHESSQKGQRYKRTGQNLEVRLFATMKTCAIILNRSFGCRREPAESGAFGWLPDGSDSPSDFTSSNTCALLVADELRHR
jgi:hypothetical protein